MLRFKPKLFIIVSILIFCMFIFSAIAFGFSKGYFMRFMVNGREISRDGFLYKAQIGDQLFCVSTLSLNQGYVDQCFDTEAQLDHYMEQS